MRPRATSPLRVAADTNLLLSLALGETEALECLGVLRERGHVTLSVPPVVEGELGYLEACDSSERKREAAKTASDCLKAWGFDRGELSVAALAIAQRIRDELIVARLIEHRERNDALALAQAGMLGCDILITSDGHLTGPDPAELIEFLEKSGAHGTVVLRPYWVIKGL